MGKPQGYFQISKMGRLQIAYEKGIELEFDFNLECIIFAMRMKHNNPNIENKKALDWFKGNPSGFIRTLSYDGADFILYNAY